MPDACRTCAVLLVTAFASPGAMAQPSTILERCLNLAEPELALPPAAGELAHPLLFVTQLPIAADLANRFSTFGNHLGQMSAAGRGGDLWILYPPDAAAGIPAGCLRNLTLEAGFGSADELQSGSAPIAVREPRVHDEGRRALFSMVQRAPTSAANPRYCWQIHELDGLGLEDPLAISHVAGQPAGYNNVSPVYGGDDDVIYFTSDQPVRGPAARHLYPQQDEYERTESVTGLWKLSRSRGEVTLMSQSPSGTFSPMLDSAGRVIVSRWDHLQRDIFAANAFMFDSEAPDALQTTLVETFPEPLPGSADLADLVHPQYGASQPLRFKHFFLWQLHGDGSGEETLNHLGRHELVHFFDRNLAQAGNGIVAHSNPRPREETVENMLHPEEDPLQPHRYVFVDAPHFQKQSAGRLLSLQAAPAVSPDELVPVPLTDPHGNDPGVAGLRRRPLPRSAAACERASARQPRQSLCRRCDVQRRHDRSRPRPGRVRAELSLPSSAAR